MAQINWSEALPPYLQFLTTISLPVYIALGVAGAIFYIFVRIQIWWYKIQQSRKIKYKYLELKPTDRTLKSPLSTTQLFATLHSLITPDSSGWFFTIKKSISFELVSTKELGIRYILRVPYNVDSIVYKNLLAYLPGVEISFVEDLLSLRLFEENVSKKLVREEFKFKNSYLYPLKTQDVLNQHDPISFTTAHMTKLEEDEIVSLQFICTPVSIATHSSITNLIKEIEQRLTNNQDISDLIRKSKQSSFVRLVSWICNNGIALVGWIVSGLVDFVFSFFFNESSKKQFNKPKIKFINELGVHKQEQFQNISNKISEPLFETTIRMVAICHDQENAKMRLKGLTSAFETFKSGQQRLLVYKRFLWSYNNNFTTNMFKDELRQRLSLIGKSTILSVSELSSLYHLPWTTTTKTEDISKIHYKELPTPLSLKQNHELDVVFAKNTYGGTTTPIGLTKLERTGHMFVIGQTRSGKSNLMMQMIIQDIQAGRGVAVIDPHGDLAKALINFIPEKRINDFIYVNPRDIKNPVGINLLELTNYDDEDEQELEKDIVAEGAIAILRKVFSNEFSKGGTSAFKIESLLRNTIHTAFLTKNPTLFTIFDLLNNPQFRQGVLQKITDSRLMDFWREEFGSAGDMQRVKMISPVNARVGRFLFSPIMKRILGQPKSTINFDDLLNNEKILICNLSKGEISEDNCEVIGTLIITKIRQAAEKRALMAPEERKPLYLYVDEFQNFATPSFIKMISELGKFGINIIIVEQSTSQQQDRSLTNVILANTGNVITFKTANPIDEDLMLAQFTNVEKGQIANLPRYHFYMKKGAVEPEDPFSGQTDPVDLKVDKEKVERLIEYSRNNYAIKYVKPEETPVVMGPKKKTFNRGPHRGNGNTNRSNVGTPAEPPKDTQKEVTKKPTYLS